VAVATVAAGVTAAAAAATERCIRKADSFEGIGPIWG
jgi:hypothetical protein